MEGSDSLFTTNRFVISFNGEKSHFMSGRAESQTSKPEIAVAPYKMMNVDVVNGFFKIEFIVGKL